MSGAEPIALVVAAATLQAAGNTLQKQRVATRVPSTSLGRLARRPHAFFGPLLRDPAWLLGGALLGVGALVGLQALASMDLSALKALGRLETLFVVLAGVVFLGERLRPCETAGVALVLAGSVLLALHAGAATGSPGTRTAHLALIAGVAGLLAFLACRPRAAPGSELELAAVAGLLFGTGDILVKGAVGRVPGGAFRVVESGSLAALAGSLEFAVATTAYLVGAILLQAAFSVGRVSVISAVTTLGSVMFPILFGLLVLGEDASAGRLLGMAGITLGIILLARRIPRAAPVSSG